jgi:hypothetical protein
MERYSEYQSDMITSRRVPWESIPQPAQLWWQWLWGVSILICKSENQGCVARLIAMEITMN